MNEEENKLSKKLQAYADSAGFKLNDDEIAVGRIIKGLLKNKKEHDEIYCPCRIVTGNKQEDKKIICPCIYHKGEIRRDGHCKCLLFWRKSIVRRNNQ